MTRQAPPTHYAEAEALLARVKEKEAELAQGRITGELTGDEQAQAERLITRMIAAAKVHATLANAKLW